MVGVAVVVAVVVGVAVAVAVVVVVTFTVTVTVTVRVGVVMRRKFWAIREIGLCIRAYFPLVFRAVLVWSVHPEGKTRQERSADLDYQVSGTPIAHPSTRRAYEPLRH